MLPYFTLFPDHDMKRGVFDPPWTHPGIGQARHYMIDFPILTASRTEERSCHSDKPLYLSRPMPKPVARRKTRKSVAKRFKITATGKVLRSHSSRRHLLSSKNAKRKRQ